MLLHQLSAIAWHRITAKTSIARRPSALLFGAVVVYQFEGVVEHSLGAQQAFLRQVRKRSRSGNQHG